MEHCLFCKIIEGTVPSTKQFEDDLCVAFNDINPKGRVHILVVPRKHIPTIADTNDKDEALLGHLINVARKLASHNNCEGYQLKFFVGAKGGQEVFHIHLHMVGV